jgi:hypothetical protein
MSELDNKKSPGGEGDDGKINTISRQKLLKAGWVVPAVLAINLPRTVQAQTIVPIASDEPAVTQPVVQQPAVKQPAVKQPQPQPIALPIAPPVPK